MRPEKKHPARKGPIPFTGDKTARRTFVEALLERIQQRHPGRRVENLLSDLTGISTYAVKAWKERGVARSKHPLVAELADLPLDEVRRAHGL